MTSSYLGGLSFIFLSTVAFSTSFNTLDRERVNTPDTQSHLSRPAHGVVLALHQLPHRHHQQQEQQHQQLNYRGWLVEEAADETNHHEDLEHEEHDQPGQEEDTLASG